MESKEIMEGNKLIAEFLGYKKEGYLWIAPIDLIGFKKAVFEGLNSDGFIFHEDWNQLMRLVDKIEELGHRFTISSTFVRVYTKKDEEYHCGVFEGKLKTTWYAVVQFIKWFNSQNK